MKEQTHESTEKTIRHIDSTGRGAVSFWLVLLCCVPFAGAAWWLSVSNPANHRLVGLDFRAFYAAGRMLLEGANLYDLAQQWQWQQRLWPELTHPSQVLFIPYPPFDVLPMALVAMLPVERAFGVWLVAETVLLALLGWLLVNSLGNVAWRTRVLVLAMVLTSLPVLLTLLHGQLSFSVALCSLLAWRSFKQEHAATGGMCLALLLIKPQFILVPLLLLVFKRQWRALGAMLGGIGMLSLLGVVIVGPTGMINYVRLLAAASKWGDANGVHPQAMHSWRSFLHRALQTDAAADVQLLWLGGAGITLLLLAWSFRGEWKPQSAHFDLQWAMLLFAITFCSPHTNAHDLCLLLVACALVVRFLRHSASREYSLRRYLAVLPVANFVVTWLWLVLLLMGWTIVPVTVIFQMAALLLLGAILTPHPLMHRTTPEQTGVARSVS
ncbi:MAG TPA: glycosyltransferase family 87 protein [Abditibacteriaceae bacterium]|jgi:hypothetical protein